MIQKVRTIFKQKHISIIILFVDEYDGEIRDNKSSSSSSSYYNDAHNKNHKSKNSHIKCFNCGKYGHTSFECKEQIDDICVKCLKSNHKGKDCPNEKCHICKKKVHKTPFCPLQNKNYNNYKIKKKVLNCTKCLNNGHKANECLIRPNDIFIYNRNNAPLCRICNSSEHYLCPFKNEVYIVSDYDSDNLVFEDEDENGEVKITTKKDKDTKNSSYIKNYKINREKFDSLFGYFLNENKKYEKEEVQLGKILGGVTKEQIKETMFCCKCGKAHNSEVCEKKKKKNYTEDNDDYYVKLNNSSNIIHKKNPLKFEPFERGEYKINHHDMKCDYYDENDSSGKSYNEIFMKKNK